MRLQSRDQIQAQQPLENIIFVSFSKSCLNYLSLKLAIIAIKTRHCALVQIYSLAVGVSCKALALAASAFATNTYVSAINLHQGSAADLNPYILVAVCILPSKYTELLPRVQRRVQVQVPTGSPLHQMLNTPNLSLTSIVSSPVNPRK